MDVAAAAGVAVPDWASADDVLSDLGRSVAAFAGITAESMGLLGVPAPAAAGV
jgi:hypothetical protein